ncbi:hypothetical protein ACQPW1_00065 [Nocardia sp. CA-128927]|uniref:hypothetical protein n=1 Tax=Nocardia sp. CA-128927 TaxID=3239975 RepID=UPI003D976B28
MALRRTEYDAYLSGSSTATALILTDPTPLTAPPTLTHLRAETGFRPPQSYRYLHADDPEILHRAASLIAN